MESVPIETEDVLERRARSSDLERAPTRRIIGETIVAVLKEAYREYFPDLLFADRVELYVVWTCIIIGYTEGKPFTVSKLSFWTHTPRATTFRRLDELIKRGLVVREGRRYLPNIDRMNEPSALATHDRVRRLVTEAGTALI